MTGRGHRIVAVIDVVVLAAAVVGVFTVSDGGTAGSHVVGRPIAHASGTGTSSPPPPTTSTTIDVGAKVLADRQAGLEAFYRLAAAPNPDDPAVAQYRTGEQLELFRGWLQQLLSKGQVARLDGFEVRARRVVSVHGSTAIVDECLAMAGGSFYDARTGQRVSEWDRPETDGIEMTMQLDGGTWKYAGDVDKPSACP